MFGGGTTNPYDEIVVKATDENQTSENWEVILNLCDKVVDEGQEGSHNAVAALIKRLAHRNANVQLYALTLAEALVKNCTIVLHREISSKAFTQALERLVTDRTAHEKVKKRALSLIAEWSAEWENDESLGLMEGLYDDLKRKGHKFDQTSEPLPPSVDDEVRRKEEEELQRVLELSMKDTGGRGTWSQYSLAATSSGGAGGSSSSAAGGSSSAAATTGGSGGGGYGAPKYQSGYVPARTPSPATQRRYNNSPPPPAAQPQPMPQPQVHQQSHYHQPPAQQAPTPSSYGEASSTTSYAPAPSAAPTQPPTSTTSESATSPATTSGIITRVRALHTFEPSEPGELAFDKGDIIKVVDRGYKDWWRGQLKGRTGIFPVNYVEPMPEPSKEELWKEAEAEAVVFGQAVNVEKLLAMLKNWDVERESLADNEEIQELYRSCMSLRPKIVKLIDKYSQKRADLVSMNEAFVRARSIFDRMMEESLARHTGIYDQQQPVPYPQPQNYMTHNRTSSYGAPPPVAPAPGGGYGGWNPSQAPGGYDQPPAPPHLQAPQQQPQGYPPYGQQGPPPPHQQQGPPPQVPTPYGGPPQGGAPGYAVDAYSQQPPPQQQQQQQQQPNQSPAPAVQPSTYGYTAPYSGQGPTPYPAQGAPAQQGPYGGGAGGAPPYSQSYGAPPEPAQQQQQPPPQQQVPQQAPPQQPQQQQQQSQLPAYGATPYAPAAQQQQPQAQVSPGTPLPDPHANLQHRQSYQQQPSPQFDAPQQQQQQQLQPAMQPTPAQQQPMQPMQAAPPPSQQPQPAPQAQPQPQPQPQPPVEEVDDLLPLPNPLENWGSPVAEAPSPISSTIAAINAGNVGAGAGAGAVPGHGGWLGGPSPPGGPQGSAGSPAGGPQGSVGSIGGGPHGSVGYIGGGPHGSGGSIGGAILGGGAPTPGQVASPEAAAQRRDSFGFGVGGVASPIGTVSSPVQGIHQQQGGMGLQQQIELSSQPTQPLHLQQSGGADAGGRFASPESVPSALPERHATQTQAQPEQFAPQQQQQQPASYQQQPAPQPASQQQQQQQQQPAANRRHSQQRAGTFDTSRPLSPSQVAEMLARGPPYIYDPSITYPDPNVQAWAQYFAQGGTDKAGAVYFVSVPGVTGPAVGGGGAPQVHGEVEELASAMGSVQVQEQQQTQQQQQQHHPGGIQKAAANAPRYQLTDTGFSGGGRVASPGGAATASVASTPSWVLPKQTLPRSPGSGNSGLL